LADDLASVLDALEIDGATLVGHSMGCGEIVRYVARSGAQRVARMALVATTTPMLRKAPDNPDGLDASFFVALRERWRQDFPGWIAENARPFFLPGTSQAMLDWVSSMLQQVSLRVAIETNRGMVDADVRPDLKRIRLPALVVHGTADASAPYQLTGQPTATLLPHCSFKTYEGAPHGLLLTHRERLNADLREFVCARTMT
jgi:pimeloyl-ACP methyl ester carboxylesterase